MQDRLKSLPWGGLALLGGLILFPFIIALSTGQPVDAGVPKFWQGMLIQVFILAVFAMSYDILMGYTGILSFGHALFFGTGAYTIGILLKHAGWDLGTALIAVIVIAIAQSLIIGLLSLRVSGVYFAMVTLAFAQMFFLLAEATDFRQWTGAEDGLQSIPVPAWISPTTERLRFYYLSLIFAVAMYLLARRIVNSPSGRVMMAIRDNETRARVLGYHTLTFKLIAITVSGVMAALAGAFNALWNLNANPAVLGVGTTINALLMTIIGGVGSLIGPMLGAAVIQLLGYWLNVFFGPSWPLLFGIVYILIVLFLPYGIVGTWRLRSAGWKMLWRQRWQELMARRSSEQGG